MTRNTIEKKINNAMRDAGCLGYSARLEASTNSSVEDDSVSILLYGQETSWVVQIGAGYCGINEYGYKDGQIDWMLDHGIFRTQAQAIKRLCALLIGGVTESAVCA